MAEKGHINYPFGVGQSVIEAGETVYRQHGLLAEITLTSKSEKLRQFVAELVSLEQAKSLLNKLAKKGHSFSAHEYPNLVDAYQDAPTRRGRLHHEGWRNAMQGPQSPSKGR